MKRVLLIYPLVLILLSLSTFARDTHHIRLNFIVKEEVIIANALLKKINDPYVIEFQKAIKKNNPNGFKTLNELYMGPAKEYINQIYNEINNPLLIKLFSAAKNNPIYRVWFEETKLYKNEVVHEWNLNFNLSLAEMQRITRFNFNKEFTVYISHPDHYAGRYLGNNIIHWGSKSRFENYSTIYLWHEILHSYMKYTDIHHAILELAADNALRVSLNNSTYLSLVGHEYLNDLRKEIYDQSWADYLDSELNLLEFANTVENSLHDN